MSRTGLYDCHIFYIFISAFMRNSNFGIGLLSFIVLYGGSMGVDILYLRY